MLLNKHSGKSVGEIKWKHCSSLKKSHPCRQRFHNLRVTNGMNSPIGPRSPNLSQNLLPCKCQWEWLSLLSNSVKICPVRHRESLQMGEHWENKASKITTRLCCSGGSETLLFVAEGREWLVDILFDGSDGGFESILILVLRSWTSVLLNRTTRIPKAQMHNWTELNWNAQQLKTASQRTQYCPPTSRWPIPAEQQGNAAIKTACNERYSTLLKHSATFTAADWISAFNTLPECAEMSLSYHP